MKNLVLTDEKIMTTQSLQPRFKRIYRKKKVLPYKSIYITGDSSFLGDYFTYAAKRSNTKFPAFKKVAYLGDAALTGLRKEFFEECEVEVEDLSLLDSAADEKPYIFFFADSTALAEKEETIAKFKKVLGYLQSNRHSRCIFSVMLPHFDAYPNEATSLAEREFNFFLENITEKTPEIEYYLELEALCRQAVRDNNADISLLRFDNVFAPERYHTPAFDLQGILEESLKNKTITINDDDFKNVFTISYVRDACANIFVSAYSAKRGHTYNVASQSLSVSAIKEGIFKAYSDVFAIQKNISANTTRLYRSLNTLKFSTLKIKSGYSLSAALKHAVSYISELEYDTSDNVAFYTGRIEQIQAVEIEMLKEIDRICVENDIKYFLAGGTLLGAVRSGGVIPWDDDLDIGMLREDYEKFRKVCKTQLSEGYSYSGPFNDSGSHYTTEKIRLDATYFSTRYSSKNVFPDGLFIDILVYDKTSNIKLFQKLQTLILAIIYDCLIVRWYNVARKNFHYRLTKFLLPILRLIPWGVYHHIFDWVSKIYMNKKDAKYLIDTVGKKLKDGPLPIDGLEDTVYVDFQGIKAPIPVDYTGYLNYAYGPTYMEKPNLSNRRCPHNFARIDLGKFIFDQTGKTPFRDVNINGELFESESEK